MSDDAAAAASTVRPADRVASAVAAARPTSAERAASRAALSALFRKAWWDAAWPLAGSCTLLFVFASVAVSLANLVDVGSILNVLPKFLTASIEKIAGLPLKDLASPAGQFSGVYVDMITIFTCLSWAVLRGSDCIAGEWGRGTLEMLLAHPLRRSTWLLVHFTVTWIGAALILFSLLSGTWLGLALIKSTVKTNPAWFIPAALNLWCFVVATAGIASAISLVDRERWRVIGVAVGFFSFSLLLKLVSRLVQPLGWLINFSYLGALDPQRLIILHDDAWRMSVGYDATLLTIAIAAHGLVLVRFERKDVAAPH